MGRSRCLWLSALFLLTRVALAQTVVEDNRSVASDSPEGWAMRYFAGTTLMTSFGEAARLPPWRWNAAVDVGNIPRLSDAQQRVAFGGSKSDDLNKSPVFGRLRLAVGLPDAWVAELGYTPPLEIAGSRARNVFAMAIGRRVIEGDAMSLSLRALGQVGKVRGDITCPASVAGNPDPILNPFDCRAPPSNDTFTTNYYGVDATIGWDAGAWKWFASAGIARTELKVQVDAFIAESHDRSRVSLNTNLPWLTIGLRYAFDPRWSVAAELLYVPLDVRRAPDFSPTDDSLTSVRAQLRYSFD